MENNTIKSICIVSFFVDTMTFGCIPYLLVGRKSSGATKSTQIRDKVTSYFNCFAGGVFLGACLLHLMVEGRETLEEYFELLGDDVDFPVYEALVACGFFLIAFVEQLALKCLHTSKTAPLPPPVAANGNIVKTKPNGTSVGRKTSVTVISGCGNDDESLCSNEEVAPVKDTQMEDVYKVRPMRAFLLLGAFSFHTVFDGLAVGLQQEQGDIWQVFGGIIIHKSLVALCLGLQLFLVYRRKPIRAFICIFMFSLISPIGIGIGMAVSSLDIDLYAKTLCRGVLEGLSTGTFLYVAFLEILHDELISKRGILRLLVVVLGFVGTMLPKLLLDEGHGEGHEEGDHHDK